jgi:hypothetical protein
MSSREDLISGAERYLRRKLTDSEIQQLMHASDSFKLGNNDALWIVIAMLESNKWSLTETLESYRDEFQAIPAQIKRAADAERASLKATADLGAIQAQDRINSSVLELLPNIRADISKTVGQSASVAIRRIELGRGMFSIWAGGMIAAALIILGILIDSGVYREVLLKPNNQVQIQKFLTNYSWAIAIGLATPPFLGLGVWMLENTYESQSKFVGWLIIFVSIIGFLVPGLKVMGWWFWK